MRGIPAALAKATLPIAVGAALAWLFGSFALIWYAYLSTLREYSAGIKSRCTEYLNLDIGRLHTIEFEETQRSSLLAQELS